MNETLDPQGLNSPEPEPLTTVGSNPVKPMTIEQEQAVGWYIVKQSESQSCEIVTAEQLIRLPEVVQRWGPYGSQNEAIERRVGLIRSGKCQPQ